MMALHPSVHTPLGFHYYPDTMHYRGKDLRIWLPELQSLGACWLTLFAPANHAIPEPFITGLVSGGIEPILHFHLPISSPPPSNDLRPLFTAYAQWGVRYAVLFDRPNLQQSWGVSAWPLGNLVERFLDIYLPIAETALVCGLLPVFPPLEPGGDYWDTAFLKSALQGIARRGYSQSPLAGRLAAYAWADHRPLDWGEGGPEYWTGTRPYYTPPGEEDQLGFRIFDWYLAIARTELINPCEILLVGAGCRPTQQTDAHSLAIDPYTHARQNLAIARLVCGETGQAHPLPPEVIACNFWLLTTSPNTPFTPHAWFQPNGTTLPIVQAWHEWRHPSGTELATDGLPNLSRTTYDHLTISSNLPSC